MSSDTGQQKKKKDFFSSSHIAKGTAYGTGINSNNFDGSASGPRCVISDVNTVIEHFVR